VAHVEDIRGVYSPVTLVRYIGESLGYRMADVTYQPGQLGIPPKPSEAIHLIRLLSDYDRLFQIYLFETASLTRTTIRSILEPFYRRHPAGDYLFAFTKDYSELAFVSPQRILRPGKPMPTLQLRILAVEPDNVYHTDLEVLRGISLVPDEQRADIIRSKHEEAFSIERVTDEFFETYKRILNDQLEKTLAAQRIGTADQVHAFAQQLLNRLMFLYFLQKKGWLKWGDGTSDKRYMRTLWRKYLESKPRDGTFYRLWLSSLFFHAFNKRSSLMPADLPGDIRASFLNMPFLNGGLFAESELDHLGFSVPDELFTSIFEELLDKYNFTVREDTPLEVEVAVDPQMLGMVYESLINEEDRHQAGIFYTPRIEIDYMCRLSLIEYLHDVTGFSKDVLIPFVMAPASEESLAGLTKEELQKLWSTLESVRVVDPAVGSGSFLVGMMNVLVQLYRAMAEPLGRHQNEFALKKRIISENLYGVDVKDWAVRVCELRLWLSLIIESEESQMDIYGQPLLPNLTFKARQGDSLVEEIAGVSLSLRSDYAHIPPSLKQRIQHIVDRKQDYFRGDRSVTSHEIDQLEHQLLSEVVDNKIKAIDAEIRRLEAPQQKAFQAALEEIRGSLDMTQAIIQRQEEARAKVQPQIDAKRAEKERLQRVAASVGKKGDKDYFLWDIDFAEVFLERDGFDIVIGNPPYVRQEEVAPPLERAGDYAPDDWRDMKRAYKEQLERAIRAHWGGAVGKIDKKSDLYVYFYYQGLDLLRPGGVFCFINSNSWLDVGYGASLQDFLLRNIAVRQVIDNHARRSFKYSDVNTVIVVLRRPSRDVPLKDNQAKFIAYKQPFESAANAENLMLQEWADSVQSTQEFRVYPITQGELWLDGLEVPEEAPSLELGAEHGKYVGGKWGGRYLRAPDIFFTILEKGKDFTRPLSEYFVGERYLNTGGADGFFILTNVSISSKGLRHVFNNATTSPAGEPFDGEIEEEYLRPLIKDYTKSDKRVEVHGYDAYCLVIEGRPSPRLQKYIKWGQAQGYHQRSVTRNQRPWYKPTRQMTGAARILVPRSFNDSFVIHFNPHLYLSLRFYRLHCKKGNETRLVAFLNSTLVALVFETLGNKSLGQGVLDFFMADFLALRIPVVENPGLDAAFVQLKDRPLRSVWEEFRLPKPDADYSNIRSENVTLDNVLPDRRALDKVVFETLGLTEEEQLAVYRAVVELVKNRLVKARSV